MSHLRVKICGITSLDDALWAAEAGADALGFIFVEGTPRYVTPAAAARDRGRPAAARVSGGRLLGPRAGARGGRRRASAAWARSSSTASSRRRSWRRCRGPVLKTIKIREAEDLAQLDRYKPAAFLLDSPARWSEGEARHPISWMLAREAAGRGRVMLAAGLTPETVGEAVRVARPWGVDVNSGVETAPGRKDPAKVERFIRAARAAAWRTKRARATMGKPPSCRACPIAPDTSAPSAAATCPRP